MTPEEYKSQLLLVASAAKTLIFIDVRDLLDKINRADTMGPIMDPTLWMKNHGKMDEDKEMLEAALPLWRWGKEMEKRAQEDATTKRGGP